MTRFLLALCIVLASTFLVVHSPAAAQPAKPTASLDGYLTVDQAKKVAVPAADAATRARPGYLGLTVEADSAGRPVVDTVQPKSPAAGGGIAKAT